MCAILTVKTGSMEQKGYFGIGVERIKHEGNLGTLWRSASILGASFIFTIGKRYKKQPTDTEHAWQKIPLFHYDSFDAFYQALPYSCRLVGVELSPDAVPLHAFQHPDRCVYLLGAEDNGLSRQAQQRCHALVQLPGETSLNVAVAGSIVLYDRLAKAVSGS